MPYFPFTAFMVKIQALRGLSLFRRFVSFLDDSSGFLAAAHVPTLMAHKKIAVLYIRFTPFACLLWRGILKAIPSVPPSKKSRRLWRELPGCDHYDITPRCSLINDQFFSVSTLSLRLFHHVHHSFCRVGFSLCWLFACPLLFSLPPGF